jgi:ketosteroid isomerase-like protein
MRLLSSEVNPQFVTQASHGDDVYFPYMAKTLRLNRTPAVFLLTVFSLTGCAPPSPPHDTRSADVRSITEGEALWVRDWSTRDTEGIVARYADEAVMMAPNSAPANGREAIREVVKQYVADGNFAFSFEPNAVDAAKSGDYGYVQGSYTLTTTDVAAKKPVTDSGTYLRIYRKQLNGGWKVSYEMRASSLPIGPRQ